MVLAQISWMQDRHGQSGTDRSDGEDRRFVSAELVLIATILVNSLDDGCRALSPTPGTIKVFAAVASQLGAQDVAVAWNSP